VSSPRFTLEHVAIAVPELIPALEAITRVLPLPVSPGEDVPQEKVRTAFLDMGGVRLEFLEPMGLGGPLDRFLAEGKRGLHHLSFRLEGVKIGEWFEELRKRGVRLIGDGPHPGSGSTQVFFVHPSSTAGVLVEFTQEEGPP
jgi:methylmalonyl-CoA epimerase